MPPSIALAGVSKCYVKYEDAPMLVSRLIALRAKSRRSKLWALRDVDLEIGQGECVGVIGRNGSGKSTLLRLLAGVTGPTTGSITVRGRVSPLIAVGVGFHPELTGRENVYVNGIVLGLTRAEISRRFDEIVAFAEIGDFIDTPVKFYSSGMFVRLGFAVAISADPSVLLVDEVLAVGDLAFQLKCYDRMMQIRDNGSTVVVVSHNLNMIRRMCDRSLVVHGGQVRYDGETKGALALYHELLAEPDEVDGDVLLPGGHRIDVAARMTRLRLLGADGRSTAHVNAGDEVVACVDVAFEREVPEPIVGFSVISELGIHVYGDFGPATNGQRRTFRAGEQATFQARVTLGLTTGSYTAGMSLASGDTMLPIAVPPTQLAFFVANQSHAKGIADLGARFGESGAEDDR
ncbi:MAG: ABC transporter ATP-binding protein [Acidimicrobiales bacterium]